MTDTRQHAVAMVREQLLRRASPRLHMSVLVVATSAVGLVASWAMLHAGVTSMAVRYPLAVVVAYLAFLGLVGLWLRRFRLRERQRDRRRERGFELDVDLVEVPLGEMLRPAAKASAPRFAGFGRGGGFSGGGSSGTWGDAASAPAAPLRLASVRSAGATAGSGGGGGGWKLDLDDDALWLVLVVAVALIVLGVAAYLVYSAPVLFAELLLDAGLAAGLYGRLSRGEPRNWLRTAVRGTIVPASIVAILLGLAGVGLERLAPGAASIGRVVEHLTRDAADRPAGTT
jgi:hypothetical protein